MELSWLRWALLLLLVIAGAESAIATEPAAGDSVAFRPREMYVQIEPVPLPVTGPVVRSAGLSLADLEGMALGRNPALAEARSQVAVAQGRWLQVGLPPNPQLGYLGTEIGNDGRAGQQGMFVEQQVITGGKLQLNRQVAQAEVVGRSQTLNAQQLRVITDVRQRFYDVQVADRTRQFTSRLLTVENDAVSTIQALLDAQETNRVTLLQAQVEAERAQITHTNAENRYQAAWRSLAAVVGEPALGPQPLQGDPEQLPPWISWEESLTTILMSSPQLAAAQARVEQARWAIRRARAEPVPDLFLQGAAQYDSATEDAMAGAQIGLPIPIINRNQGGISAAVAELSAAQAAVARLELALQQRLAVVYERYANAAQQVQRYQETMLPRADDSLELIRTGYRAGEFDYLTLLTAQRTFAQVNLSYLESLRELRNAAAEIEGLLLTDALGAPGTNEGFAVQPDRW